MANSDRVVIDTSAFYALASGGDRFHDSARYTFERLIDHERELWTTSYALVETIALMQNRLGFAALSDFMNGIDGLVSVFWIDSALHNRAWSLLTENQGAGLSLVDWTVALVSRRLDAQTFTFDGGFANQQGLYVIPR